jgi:hypothetical protein
MTKQTYQYIVNKHGTVMLVMCGGYKMATKGTFRARIAQSV